MTKQISLHECQKWAEKNDFDNAEFYADFPVGKKKCRWLDAYFGMFEIPGITDGFVMVNQIEKIFPDLRCTVIEKSEIEESK